MEKLEADKGKEVTCDTIAKKMYKWYRATGYGTSIVVYPGETELTGPGYSAEDKSCHFCKEKEHLRNDCPKLARKQNGKMCEYSGCTMKVGHTTDKCWKDPKNEKISPSNWVTRIKENTNEASPVETFR